MASSRGWVALARIFTALAVITWLLLAANFAAGLWIGDFNAAARAKQTASQRMGELQQALRLEGRRTSPEFEQARSEFASVSDQFAGPRSRMTLHMLLGTAAALMAILVSSITITYFIGTSRWCKEVCATYKLPVELAERSARLKRAAFPWALGGVLTIILIVGLGAAADPSGANHARSASLVMPHYLAAMLGLALIAAAFWMQVQRITENHAVIEEILAEVQRIRRGQQESAAAQGWAG